MKEPIANSDPIMAAYTKGKRLAEKEFDPTLPRCTCVSDSGPMHEDRCVRGMAIRERQR